MKIRFVQCIESTPAGIMMMPTDGLGHAGILRRQMWLVQDVLALSDIRTETAQPLPLEGRSGRGMSQKAIPKKSGIRISPKVPDGPANAQA